jgi:hypothetical protein
MAELQQAGLVIQLLPTAFSQLGPELVRAPEQRHVVRMFEIRQTDNTGIPMRTPAIMTGWKTVYSQCAYAPTGEMIQGGAADPPGADDDAIILLHVIPLKKMVSEVYGIV